VQAASKPQLTRAALVPILAGLLLTLLLAALDSTIVATAMPRIAADLRGFDRYSWVSVAYLLASTVTVPVVSKLADQYGRRPFLIVGALTFLGASVLCAIAGSLEQLVAFRLLQGVGAGTITAAVFAAVPTLFAPDAGARIIGLFTGTYGLASIVGPLLGGIITDAASWRGVFWINVPIALVALTLVVRAYPAERVNRAVWVDYAGAAALVGGVSPILLALLVGGRDIAWSSPLMAGLLLGGLLLLALFVWIERHAVEPIIPLAELRTRSLGAPVLGSALMNAGVFAILLFAPLFMQDVIGQSATQSGGVLAPMMIAWVLASVASGQVIARVGRTRPVGVVGMAVATLGLALLAGMGVGTQDVVVTRNLIIAGIGLGIAVSAFVVAAQTALPVEQAGVAVGLTTFGRAMGGTMASAALGGVLVAASGGVSDASAMSVGISRTYVVATVVVALGIGAAALLRDRQQAAVPGQPARRAASTSPAAARRKVVPVR
jgi:EmrB/QacA subfamily drug resistance transporter